MFSLSFVGPAMSDAISNLGGGGLSTPYLGNLANSINYGSGCLMTLFGGPLIIKFGIRNSCMIAALVMPLGNSAYYVSAKYGVDWYLLLTSVSTLQPILSSHSILTASEGSWRVHLWLLVCCRDCSYALLP